MSVCQLGEQLSPPRPKAGVHIVISILSIAIMNIIINKIIFYISVQRKLINLYYYLNALIKLRRACL